MTPPALDEDRLRTASTDEIHSALFGQLVSGHAQMALMLLGQISHPETGQQVSPSLADAKMFIDQLEMIQAKTRGNLNADETRLLQQALTAVHQAMTAVMDAGLEAYDTASAPPGTVIPSSSPDSPR